MELNHFELCKLTANRFLKESDIILYEYNCQIIVDEMPDVLCFKNGYTTLYEIKTSLTDFKAEEKKEGRIKYKNRYYTGHRKRKGKIETFFYFVGNQKNCKEYPHLGRERYYVVPYGLINKEDVEEWGLYWVKGKRFYKKKESALFVRNIHLEIKLLSHAFRKFGSLKDPNILVNSYEE